MSSKRSLHALMTGAILLGLAGIGFYTLNRSLVSPQGGAPSMGTPAGIPAAPTPSSTAGSAATQLPTLVVETTDGTTHKLIRRDGGEDKLLFTDADEPFRLSGLFDTAGSDLYAAATPTAQSNTSQVIRIKTDGSGKAELIKPAATLGSVAVSRDGTQVAAVSFDNAEGSVGFTLKTRNLTGGGDQTVEQSPDGIALPRWSTAGALAYVVGQAAPDHGQAVKVHKNGTSTTVFTSTKSQAITDLAWLGEDRLALVVEPLGNNAQNKASIVIIATSDGTVSKTYDLQGKERSLRTDRTGQYLALVSGDIKGAGETTGPVTVINLGTGDQTSRGEAIAIAGFLP